MIIVDKALAKCEHDKTPIRVAVIGAGFMGQGIAYQLVRVVPGMRLVAISNRRLERAQQAYRDVGVEDVQVVETVAELEDSIAKGRYAVTEDASLLCRAEGIDAIIEATGTIEFGARVVLSAIQHGKHVILANAELDGTIGPILKVYADKAGVIFTNTDGDQPGVEMNLYRFVAGLGVKPVLCGSMKQFLDRTRNPTTQQGFAKRWKQSPEIAASAADGTKVAFEQATVANATGMQVAKRGMLGPKVPVGTPINEAISQFPVDALLSGPGWVDYVEGASPAPGVFVVGTHDDPGQRECLDLYKMGSGPLYCFFTPYHLCHFETPQTVARAVLFNDATIAPLGAPQVDVVATAKINLAAGEIVDGLGQYMTYGICENTVIADRERLLPMGLAEGCRLKRNVPGNAVLTFDDVEMPANSLAHDLWLKQRAYFQEAEGRLDAPPAAAADRIGRGAKRLRSAHER